MIPAHVILYCWLVKKLITCHTEPPLIGLENMSTQSENSTVSVSVFTNDVIVQHREIRNREKPYRKC